MIARRQAYHRSISAFSAAALILALAACGAIEIASAWRTAEITIDGQAGEWGGHLRVIEKTPYAVGVLNDGEYLYVCLRGDAAGGAGMFDRTGLTVWIDPAGGRQKYLGVRYPIGTDMPGFGGPERPFDDPSMGGRRGQPRPGGPPESAEQVEILGPGRDESAIFQLDELKGFEVRLSRAPGGFVYELKAPLKKSESAPIAAEVSPAGIVGLGFEPGDDMGMMGNRGAGGMGGIGGMGGMGGRGGMPGGMGGMGGRGSMRGADMFKAWFKVILAKPPQAAALKN